MVLRKRLRLSYGCDCGGDSDGGRIEARLTDGILNTVEQWTGVRPLACPWRAFFDPFVARVMHAYRFFESGQLSWAHPTPSSRLVAGVEHYHGAVTACHGHRAKLDAEARRRGH